MERKKILILLMMILLWSCRCFSQDTLKILTYNVYKGFDNDSVVKEQYIDWVKKKGFDIIGYEEMKHFTQEEFKDFTERYNHSYSILSQPKGTPVAFSSIYPLNDVRRLTGMTGLYAKIHGIHIFVFHLSPFSYSERANQLKAVLKQATSLPDNEPKIIMGDFNAFARSDQGNYGQELYENMKDRDKKYDQTNLNDGLLDYSVMDLMTAAGYTDAYRFVKDKYQFSLPTKKYRTRATRRIDYIWVDNTLKKKLINSEIIVDDDTEAMSDHYPLYIELLLK